MMRYIFDKTYLMCFYFSVEGPFLENFTKFNVFVRLMAQDMDRC